MAAVIGSDPVTVILSEKGWIRAAKGHEIDPQSLAYRSGDSFLGAALGRSNQSVYLLDSTGRSYALPAHELPSARTQGEQHAAAEMAELLMSLGTGGDD